MVTLSQIMPAVSRICEPEFSKAVSQFDQGHDQAGRVGNSISRQQQSPPHH